MNIKNNKGFSLIEVLVTVGLIGVLVSIAVPSYRNYKQGTIRMAMKVDLGNTQKVYGAKYAVDSSYCHSFDTVGLSTDKKDSPIYKNKGFFGFGATGTATDSCVINVVDVRFLSPGDGTCADSSAVAVTVTSAEACKATTGNVWTATQDTAGENADACILATNSFLVGAYTDASSLNTIIQGDHDGVITEHATKKDCQP